MVARVRDNPRASGPLDKKIGQRIRDRRLEIGMSQGTLAEKLGITFQQVQKYEKGINRVAAATLMHISQVFNVPVTALLPDADTSSPASILDEPGVGEFLPLLRTLSPEGRRVLASIARGLVKEPNLASAKRRRD